MSNRQRARGRWVRPAWVILLTVAMVASATGAEAQSASPASPAPSSAASAFPAPSVAPCPDLTTANLPFRYLDANRVLAFGAVDPATNRYAPGDTWQMSNDPDGVPVQPIGAGTVLAIGAADDPIRGGIVVVEHTGQLRIPPTAADAPFAYAEESADALLTVYQGLSPSPDLAVGACVTPDTVLGITGASCDDVNPASAAPSCAFAPPPLQLQLRMAWTADPTMRSADWRVVGQPEDSVDGAFLDAQRMVEDGLRDPSAFIEATSAASPSASPTPTGEPTPPPITDAAELVLAGVPDTIRDTCTPRTTRLITGTIAAVDCFPNAGHIAQISYYLLRPADARFVFTSRMAEHGAKSGADCHAGTPGIESRSASASVGCFVDSSGKANLRFVDRDACPAVYVGVLGTGKAIAALADGYDSVVGGMWQDAGSDLKACRSDSGSVSRPPSPTNVVFEVHPKPWTGEEQPDYRLEVSWKEQVQADTTIEVYAVRRCPSRSSKADHYCIRASDRLPRSSLKLQATAPAADGTVSWMVPGWEVIGGPVGLDKEGKDMWALVVRAVNAHGASRFVIPENGNGFICSDCTY